MKMEKQVINASDGVNFAEPKSNINRTDSFCVQCGRKVGANPWFVECINGGSEIRIQNGKPVETDTNYQAAGYMGWWPVGNECAKTFAPNLLFKAKKQELA